ncbi:MAG: glutamine amidotransferase [Thermoleophilaceae bacterium]|nr:glutamine amidotransferase [Thermoleophilaceae bacterium]
MSPVLRVCGLYPDLMNIYADRGNLILLQRRCEWRGIGFEFSRCGLGDRLDPSAADLLYIGGGQDRDQALVAEDLVANKRGAVHEAAGSGVVLLAVCGGYQLLGESYALGERTLPGVGLVDLRTVRGTGPRLIGNCVIEADLGGGPRQIAGFENHGGRTHLGPGATALGRVIKGHGNNGEDRLEGVCKGNVFGTYLHGPLLPKNAWLADVLIELALDVELDPLDDTLEQLAHQTALRAAGV